MTSFLNGMSSPKQRESAMLFTDPHSAKNVRVPGPDYEELLLHNSSDSIATRLVYIPNDNIDHIVHSSRVGVDSVVCVHRLGKIGMIVEFFDMRDSVEFFAKCGVDSEGSEGSNCTFCCPTILSKVYSNQNGINMACRSMIATRPMGQPLWWRLKFHSTVHFQ